MDDLSVQTYNLGELLHEFVDEYSYLYFLTQEKLKEGLSFSLIIRGDKVYPILNENAPKGYLRPIERVNQFQNWLTPDWKIFQATEFIDGLQKMRFKDFHHTIFFEKDIVQIEFWQNDKELKKIECKMSSNKPWNNISPNQQMIPWLKTKSDNLITVKIKLIQESSDRQQINQLLNIYPGIQGEKFFNIFLTIANKKHKDIFNEYDVKQLNIKPKGLYSLYHTVVQQDTYGNPSFNRLYQAIRANSLVVLPDDELAKYVYIKNKINDLNNNQLPFTKKN